MRENIENFLPRLAGTSYTRINNFRYNFSKRTKLKWCVGQITKRVISYFEANYSTEDWKKRKLIQVVVFGCSCGYEW